MKRKGLLLFFSTLVGLALLVSCGGGGGDGKGTDGKGDTPCAPADLVAPVPTFPTQWQVVDDLTPTLTWTYPDPTCWPEGYNMALYQGPEETFTGLWYNDSAVWGWTPGVPLEPGEQYTWRIEAFTGSMTGGESVVQFYTGPMCATEALAAPDLVWPANGATVNEIWPSLVWDYPDGCLPEGYRIDLSTDPTFADTSLSGGTGNPSTSWSAGHPLDDCQIYYWKVAPINDVTLGPESSVRSFYIDVNGTCPSGGVPRIAGTVFHDLCGVPELGPLPDPLPIGCIDPGGGGFSANGIFDPGEPGIPDVLVRLSAGACPSATEIETVLTDSNGEYSFAALTPGTFCVSVAALSDGNDLQLIPGGWTAPPGGISGDVASYTINFTGPPVTDADFGWDFQFLPSWGDYGPITGMVWHDLCSVAPGDTPPSPLPDGCVDDGGVIHADGIRQPEEPGIPGVVVDIGYGDCPSAGLAEAVTDANGLFTFYAPFPADYCLRVDAEGATNAAILLPGRWTMVPSGHMGMTFRAVSLTDFSGLADQDFGWDYDDLPLTFTPPPWFHLLMNAHCRLGPSTQYPIVTSFAAGDRFEIGGISQDRSWAYHEQYRCFVALSTGEIQDATGSVFDGRILDDAAVIPGPALITDTPQFTCSAYTDQNSCTSHYPYCEWYTPLATQGRPYCRNR